MPSFTLATDLMGVGSATDLRYLRALKGVWMLYAEPTFQLVFHQDCSDDLLEEIVRSTLSDPVEGPHMSGSHTSVKDLGFEWESDKRMWVLDSTFEPFQDSEDLDNIGALTSEVEGSPSTAVGCWFSTEQEYCFTKSIARSAFVFIGLEAEVVGEGLETAVSEIMEELQALRAEELPKYAAVLAATKPKRKLEDGAYTPDELAKLPRHEIQAIAKDCGVRANGTNTGMTEGILEKQPCTPTPAPGQI